jgi:hypothetical protein
MDRRDSGAECLPVADGGVLLRRDLGPDQIIKENMRAISISRALETTAEPHFI